MSMSINFASSIVPFRFFRSDKLIRSERGKRERERERERERRADK